MKWANSARPKTIELGPSAPDLPSSAKWGQSTTCDDAAPSPTPPSLPSSSINERTSRAINGKVTTSAPSSSSIARESDNAHGNTPKIFNVHVSHSHLNERSKIELLTVLYNVKSFQAEKLAQELAQLKASSAPPADKILTGTEIPVAPSKKSRRRRRHRRGRRGRPPRQGRNIYHRTTTTQSTHPCPSSTSIPSKRDDMKNIASSYAPSPKRRRRRRRYRSRYRKNITSSATKLQEGPTSTKSTCRGHGRSHVHMQDGRAAKAVRARYFDSSPSKKTDTKLMCHLLDTTPSLTYNNQFQSALGNSDVLDCDGGEVASQRAFASLQACLQQSLDALEKW